MKIIKTFRNVFLMALVILSTNCFAQPLPDMYVERDAATERKAFFLMKSQFLLKDNSLKMDTKDSIFFPIAAFKAMIAHFGYVDVKIIFARFPINASPYVPDGWEKQITILFSPLSGGTPSYYVLNDHGSFNAADNNVPKILAEAWIKDYETNVMPVLIKTINKGARENYYPDRNGSLSDTRTIYYCKEAIKQFIEEVDHQNTIHSNPNFITGIKCFFSAYGKNGVLMEDGSIRYKKRMIIQFAFTTTGEITYDIETADRDPKVNACREAPRFIPIDKSAFDNGQLCPANCPN